MKRPHRREAGVALTYVVIFLFVIIAFTAVGMDIARLAFVATEVQTVADAAARGGAEWLGEQGGLAGQGIVRAQQIAHMNRMNGAVVLNADIDVDEGFYDAGARTFECCTSHSSCCSGSRTMYDWRCVGAGAQCAGGTRAAVLAMPHTPVDSIAAGVFDWFASGRFATAQASGAPNSTITVDKVAVASLTGPGSGCTTPAGCAGNDWGCFCSHGQAPCLPIGVPKCQFPVPCDDAPGACQLPAFNMGAPGGDTAAWTGFQNGHSTPDVRGFLDQPPLCQAPGSYTAPGTQGVFGSNNTIDVTNGVTGNGQNNPFNLTKCVFDNHLGCAQAADGSLIDGNGSAQGGGGTIFTVPVYNDNTCPSPDTGTQSIVGFATIRITAVQSSGGAANEIDIQTISHTSSTPAPGGGICAGTDCAVSLGQ